MASGPSKQELEMYWQNSRQYFDELAKHYLQADPQYYKEYIQPFYSNPFRTSSGSTVSAPRQFSGGAKLAILAFILLIVIGIAGVVFFLVFQTSGIENIFDEKKTSQKETIQRETVPKSEEVNPTSPEEEENPGSLSPEDNFIIGSKYLGEKKYDKAEYHLKQIKPGQKYYKEAQQILKNMKFLREHNK